ncbi:MAG: DUF5655 domain-containing protein [bacterium]
MKTSKDYELEFLINIKEKTGKDLNSWLKILKETSFSKMKETVDWLKKEKGMNHSEATFLTGIFLNNGKPVYDNDENLLSALFKGKDSFIPVYKELENQIKSTFSNIITVPTKTYISFRDGREFAVASIKSREMRVGMDLGDIKFDGYVQKAASLGAMPRISHMIVITEKSEINKKLIDLLKIANHRVKQP